MLPDYPDRSALHESLCVDASELKEGIRREALTPIAARFENQTNDPKFSRGCALTILGSQLMLAHFLLITLKIFSAFPGGKTLWLN